MTTDKQKAALRARVYRVNKKEKQTETQARDAADEKRAHNRAYWKRHKAKLGKAAIAATKSEQQRVRRAAEKCTAAQFVAKVRDTFPLESQQWVFYNDLAQQGFSVLESQQWVFYNDLAQQGFSVLPEVLDKDTVDKLLHQSTELLQTKKQQPLPRTNRKYTDKRVQVYTPTKSNLCKKSNAVFDELMNTHSNGIFIFTSAAVLHSKEGCPSQVLHSDYQRKSHLFREQFPVFMFIALQDHTTVMYQPGSIDAIWTEPELTQEVHLTAGQVLVLHGLLLHAGAPYAQPNTRLHVYGDTPGALISFNSTTYLRNKPTYLKHKPKPKLSKQLKKSKQPKPAAT